MSAEQSFGRMCKLGAVTALTVISAVPTLALAQATGNATLPLVIGQGAGGTSYSVPIQTLLFFTALSFLPAVLLLMTGFKIGRAHV